MRRQILIADDEEANRAVLGELFERNGYGVTLAGDGREAVEYAEHHPVSLGIFDYQMPRMSGLEALRTLRAHKHSMPVLIMTSQRSPQLEDEALSWGANGFFYKPLDLGYLRQIVINLVGEETGLSVFTFTTTLTIRQS